MGYMRHDAIVVTSWKIEAIEEAAVKAKRHAKPALLLSSLWDTSEEVYAHWRGDLWNECKCGRDEPVTLFTDYGDGFHWPGRVCRHCRAITAGREPDDTIDGTPEWVHSANVSGQPRLARKETT